VTPRGPARPLAPVPRYTLTRREAAASLGVSLNHFERKIQPELKVVISGQLILIPVTELERWVQRHAHQLMEVPSRDVRDGQGEVSA
jgi:excisionase family DNA binding protein